MSNFWEALKAGAKAAIGALGPDQYVVHGKQVLCPHCSNDSFLEGPTQPMTSGRLFVGWDWTNQAATTLLCSECGRIEWFMTTPERLSDYNRSVKHGL